MDAYEMNTSSPGSMPPPSRNFRPASTYGYSGQQQGTNTHYGGYSFGAGEYDMRSPRSHMAQTSDTMQFHQRSPYQGYGFRQNSQPYGYVNEVPVSPLGASMPVGMPITSPSSQRRRASSKSSSSGSNSPRAPLEQEDVESKKKSFATPTGVLDQPSYPFPANSDYTMYPGDYDGASADPVVMTMVPTEDTASGPDSRFSADKRSRYVQPGLKRRAVEGGVSAKGRKPGARAGRGREPQETYTLSMPSAEPGEADVTPQLIPGVTPLATLENGEYREVFQQLNDQFCQTSFRWLARYKFQIPKKSNMRNHVTPGDRELTEYVQIIKFLIEGREVPRNAVRDERVNELVSVMEGASEIRHVCIHVSRKNKPDRRVLGFIAAVSEFCWILGDRKGAMETNELYARTEKLTKERQLRIERAQAARSPEGDPEPAVSQEKDANKRKRSSRTPSPGISTQAACA